MPPPDTHYTTLRNRFGYLPKDFVETEDGWLCAVVVEGFEAGRVIVSPRYLRSTEGECRKLTTEEGRQLLNTQHSDWMFYSPSRDVTVPALPQSAIARVYLPTEGLQAIIARSGDHLAAFRAVADILQPLLTQVGITGSHLIDAAGPTSDIDLVVYGRQAFAQAQQLFTHRIDVGDQIATTAVHHLSDSQWRATYERRGCRDLTLQQYIWHERRKLNKFSMNGIKVDLTCVDASPASAIRSGRKLGIMSIQGRVSDASYAYTSPAVFMVEHELITTIVVYTATYVGQAQVGDEIEARGHLERDDAGKHRLVIGASREAQGEYLRVLAPH